MNDEDNSQNQAGASTNADNHAPPRPFVVSREFQPAPDSVLDSVLDTALLRPVVATDDVVDASGEPWPFRGQLWPDHDEPVRQTAPVHEQPDAFVENEPLESVWFKWNHNLPRTLVSLDYP